MSPEPKGFVPSGEENDVPCPAPPNVEPKSEVPPNVAPPPKAGLPPKAGGLPNAGGEPNWPSTSQAQHANEKNKIRCVNSY